MYETFIKKYIDYNVDTANLNVPKTLLNVQDQHLTIHELSDDEIEFMIHGIAIYIYIYVCACVYLKFQFYITLCVW